MGSPIFVILAGFARAAGKTRRARNRGDMIKENLAILTARFSATRPRRNFMAKSYLGDDKKSRQGLGSISIFVILMMCAGSRPPSPRSGRGTRRFFPDGGNRRDWFPGVRGPRAASGAHRITQKEMLPKVRRDYLANFLTVSLRSWATWGALISVLSRISSVVRSKLL